MPWPCCFVERRPCKSGRAIGREDHNVVDRICNELETLLKDKGYTSVQDVIGKLKPWSKDGAALSRAAKKQRNGKTASVGSLSSQKFLLANKNNSMLTVSVLNAILVVVIAILLADKYNLLSLPE